MEHEVLFRDIAAAELKVRCNLEVEALGELFIQCCCVIGTLFCVPTHPRLSPSRYVHTYAAAVQSQRYCQSITLESHRKHYNNNIKLG